MGIWLPSLMTTVHLKYCFRFLTYNHSHTNYMSMSSRGCTTNQEIELGSKFIKLTDCRPNNSQHIVIHKFWAPVCTLQMQHLLMPFCMTVSMCVQFHSTYVLFWNLAAYSEPPYFLLIMRRLPEVVTVNKYTWLKRKWK